MGKLTLGLSGALLLAGAGRVATGAVTTTIGTQHFTDGQILTSGVSQYTAAVTGQPAPFNAFMGSDTLANSNFAATYTFNYAPTAVQNASVTIGIYDGDSAAPGPQVGLFSVDGVDATAAANAAFDGHGGTQAEYDVYTIPLPASALANLTDGSATVVLDLIPPGLAGTGGTTTTTSTSDGAGLDFSTLTVNAVPEPASASLMAVAAVAGLLRRRRRA